MPFGGFTKNNIIMKKTILSIVVLLSLLFLTSCDKNKEVKQFATDFAAAVQSGNKSEITKMYPGAASADSLVFTFDAEKAEIEELESGGWKVVLGEGKDIFIVKNEADGTLSIKDSHGVFFIPDSKKDFALKTGWIEKGMSDIQILERFLDTGFEASLIEKYISDIKKSLSAKITGSWGDDYYGGTWISAAGIIITLVNKSTSDIPASAYDVIYRTWYWGDPSNKLKEIIKGKDVPAGKSITLKTSKLGANMESDNDLILDFHPDTLQATFYKNYLPTGSEYKEYLSSKK